MNRIQKILVSIWIVLTALVLGSSFETVFMGGGRMTINWTPFLSFEAFITIPLLALYLLWGDKQKGGMK